MSNSSNDRRPALRGVESLRTGDVNVLKPVRAAAFWTAIALPFLYIPLLVTGLPTRSVQMAFVLMLACNALALLVGHPHYHE